MKLKEIVERAIERGFELKRLLSKYSHIKFTIFGWSVVDNTLTVNYTTPANRKIHHVHFSISDVLFNHHLLGSLCNYKRVCERCGSDKWFNEKLSRNECFNCSSVDFIDSWLWNVGKVAQHPTDTERIDYVFNLIKGDDDE